MVWGCTWPTNDWNVGRERSRWRGTHAVAPRRRNVWPPPTEEEGGNPALTDARPRPRRGRSHAEPSSPSPSLREDQDGIERTGGGVVTTDGPAHSAGSVVGLRASGIWDGRLLSEWRGGFDPIGRGQAATAIRPELLGAMMRGSRGVLVGRRSGGYRMPGLKGVHRNNGAPV